MKLLTAKFLSKLCEISLLRMDSGTTICIPCIRNYIQEMLLVEHTLHLRCLYLPIQLCTYPPTHPSIHPSIHLSIYQPTHLPTYLLSIHLPTYLFIYLYLLNLSIYLYHSNYLPRSDYKNPRVQHPQV
jgi:hypothetical protein